MSGLGRGIKSQFMPTDRRQTICSFSYHCITVLPKMSTQSGQPLGTDPQLRFSFAAYLTQKKTSKYNHDKVYHIYLSRMPIVTIFHQDQLVRVESFNGKAEPKHRDAQAMHQNEGEIQDERSYYSRLFWERTAQFFSIRKQFTHHQAYQLVHASYNLGRIFDARAWQSQALQADCEMKRISKRYSQVSSHRTLISMYISQLPYCFENCRTIAAALLRCQLSFICLSFLKLKGWQLLFKT